VALKRGVELKCTTARQLKYEASIHVFCDQ